MVENRQAGIPEIGFEAPCGTPPGIEVLSLDRLRSRVGQGFLTVPRRPSFHHLLNVTQGTLRHTVDFTDYTVRPGTWLWARPGQVQQWGDLTHADGTLILFEPDFLDPATAATARLHDPHAPVLCNPGEDDRNALQEAIKHLGHTFNAPLRLPLDVHLAVLRHLLAVLVLRLAHPVAADSSPPPEPNHTFVRFRDEVEREFTRTRQVEDYARTLGYSARTLSRATLLATGLSAKQFIDDRVILEAKRLLAHTGHSAAQIAGRLGFTNATNFSKYFHQRAGTTPIGFRDALRGKDRAGQNA